MQMNRRKALAAVLAFAASLPPKVAGAQGFPNRPIRVILPFAPGGTGDVIARLISQEMAKRLGQPMVVENRAGANGVVGATAVARAAPDGHTLLFVTPSFAVNPSVYRQLPYDIGRDFVPISNAATGVGYLLMVHPSVPAQSVRELVDLARDPASRLSYSSPGIGNTIHLAGEIFKLRTGMNILHVPYRSSAQAFNALLAGEVQMTFLPPTIAVEQIRAGGVRALAICADRRWASLPDLPTIEEMGFPDPRVGSGWIGWFAPGGTPPGIVRRLYEENRAALSVPAVRDAILAGGYEPDGSTPEQFAQLVRHDMAVFAEAVQIANIQPE